MKNIAVLVLAAGKSSRMKSIKQLEKINNKTLLDITLEKAKNIFNQHVYCVLGSNINKIKQEISTKNVQFIENKNFNNGLSTSILAGINYFKEQHLNFDGVLILLADQPAIADSYLKSLVNLFAKNTDKIIGSNYGNKLGVPAIFPKNYFTDLALIKGDKGARDFINQRKNNVLFSQSTTNFIDIDTKQDLDKFKKTILK